MVLTTTSECARVGALSAGVGHEGSCEESEEGGELHV